ncbi:MAG: DUF885 domain-containing protein [Candidatus Dormibacteria bacterium]
MPAAAPLTKLNSLGDRYVAELFDFNPGEARASGEHSYDGRLGPVGAGATARRVEQLDELAAELATVTSRHVEERADEITLRQRLALERFHLVELDAARRNPLAALFRGADPQPYCTHGYAPVPARAEGLIRQLAQLPEWLDAALDELGDSLDSGPRQIAIAAARGLAFFYSEGVDSALPLPEHSDLRAALHARAATAAQACTRYADTIESRHAHPDAALGEARFLALLNAQEGVSESLAGLRAIADAEMSRLRDQFEKVSRTVSPDGGIARAVATMEDDHPSAGSLIDEAAAGLERLAQFWSDSNALTVPGGHCGVTASPPHLRHVTAALDPAGTLASPEVESNYIVTPVDASMNQQQAEQWLRSLNRWTLENIAVHEVYPGHFVHFAHARGQRSRLRKVGFVSGFGEGWAHYTEQLAIEQGMADDRPLLHLAQLQDALLRACRFRATLMIHTEGRSVDDATAMFVKNASMPEYPAHREAERATYDPMYLAYTYGKLQILEWRAELQRRPGFSLRRFHDTLLGSGFPPLAAVRELALSPS